jgi:acetolactate synthase-1/2/3 large subunit
LATAKDFELPIIFIVWNNQGYGEIESSMLAVGVTPIGVSPMPPILDALAIAYGLKYMQLVNVNDLSNVLQQAVHLKGPMLLEINEPQMMSQLETMTTCI